jgi:outer membrane protein OmpA-like peptidoglycan-associated protein
MKKYFLAVIAVMLSLKALGQTAVTSVNFVTTEHYSGYIEEVATGERTKIMWYPSLNMYRRCNHFEPLRAVPQGFRYIDQDSGCVEDIPSGPSASAGTSYSNIQFEFDSSVLKTSSYPVLDATSADMRTNSSTITLAGYASSEGTAAHNLRLSKDRANSVKTYLINSGVDPKRIKVKGFGETHPIADNSTEEGRMVNRRVEFHK